MKKEQPVGKDCDTVIDNRPQTIEFKVRLMVSSEDFLLSQVDDQETPSSDAAAVK